MTNNEMKIKGGKTGYPHIDMPWMHFYDESAKDFTYPNMTITEYIKDKVAGHEELIDDTYYTRDFTYGETLDNIDNASRALRGLGISKGDKILCMVPCLPSMNQFFFGAAQIGAHCDYIDPRPDSADLLVSAHKVLDLIKREKPKYIVALDRVYMATLCLIENELKELGINNIIIVRATDDMTIRGKFDYINDLINYNNLKNARMREENIKKLSNISLVLKNIKQTKEINQKLNDLVSKSNLEIIYYKDLIVGSRMVHFEKDKDNKTTVYTGHTSGTSGAMPKPIELTNENLVVAMQHLIYGNVPFLPGEKVVQELPYFAPFGLCDNMLLNKISLAHSFVVPEFQIGDFGYLVKKYRPNITMTTPAWAASLVDCPYLTRKEISTIRKVMFGGDNMAKPDEERLKEFLIRNGSSAIIEKGHGMSETAGCMCFSTGDHSDYESIGIPLPGVIYGIVDPDITDRLVPLRLKDGEDSLTGEVVISSAAITAGKLYDETIVKHYTMDGQDYIRTNDIVTMKSNGMFYFEERKDRTFSRFDGYKYKPREVERVMENIPYINNCIITGFFDNGKNGIMPMAHIELSKECALSNEIEIVEDIINRLIQNNSIVSRQLPIKFKFYDELPQTKNGKVDFKKIGSLPLDGTEIDVEIEETNLSVDSIKVYNKTKKLKK